MELLVALGLGASLSAALMQLFTGSMQLQSAQNAVQDQQQRAAYAQFLLRAAIRQSASFCPAGFSGETGGVPGTLELLAGHTAAIDVMPGSHILRVLTADCEAPVHFYFVRRSDHGEISGAGLFRRRQRGDGSYFNSEELIEGVTAMTATVGISLPGAAQMPSAPAHVAYIDASQVDNWSQAFSVNLTLSVRSLTEAGEMGNNGLTMTFSTALRQTELAASARAID
jgi:type II secretory pathway pseudopilin PulG